MPDHAGLIRVARYRPGPGRRDELLERMRELAGAMRDLPGLFGAQVCLTADASDWIIIVSRWRDEEAMRHIVGTPAAQLVDVVAGLADEEVVENFVSV